MSNMPSVSDVLVCKQDELAMFSTFCEIFFLTFSPKMFRSLVKAASIMTGMGAGESYDPRRS